MLRSQITTVGSAVAVITACSAPPVAEITNADMEAIRASHEPQHDLERGGGVALGWHISAGGRSIWHNGGTGGSRSFCGFDPNKKIGVVVLANSGESVDDIGMHLLDPGMELAERKPLRKLPLFKKD